MLTLSTYMAGCACVVYDRLLGKWFGTAMVGSIIVKAKEPQGIAEALLGGLQFRARVAK